MRIAIAVASIVWAVALPAQSRLVKNIGSTNRGSYPDSLQRFSGSLGNQPRFSTVGKWTYFNAWIGGKREVLYRTDGTAAGTERVIDLNPTPNPYRNKGDGAFDPKTIGNKLFFLTRGTQGHALYVTDALTNKTTLLMANGAPSSIVFKSELWFSNQGAAWKSDGTLSGTRSAGISTKSFWPLFVFKGELYYYATTSAAYSLYKTDGTASGTKALTLRYEFREPVVSGGLVYFYHQQFLYVSDLTAAGTRALSGRISPTQLVPVSGGVFFAAIHPVFGTEPGFSDGKTVKYFDLNPGSASSYPYGLMAMGKGVAFLAKGVDPTSRKYVGVEPWLFDGSSFVVHDLVPNGDSSPASLLQVGTKVLVGARNGLFAIDRSTKVRVHGVQNARYMAPTPKGTVFAGTWQGDTEPWVTDGTTVGTQLIKNIEDSEDIRADAPVGNLIAGGDRVFFTARHDHREQWESDGKTAGTRLIGTWPMSVKETHLVWNGLLFVEGESAGVRHAMVFDLRTNKSQVLRFQGRDLLQVTGFRVFRDAVWFLANEGKDRVLYKTSGATVQQVRVVGTSIWPGDGSLALFRDRLYFLGVDSGGGRLWSSDGTSAGTGVVPGIVPQDPRLITAVKDALFFVGIDKGSRDLYSTDGTAKGTVGVGLQPRTGIWSGRFGTASPFSVEARGLAHTVDRVFFVTNSGLNEPNNTYSGHAVWSSDGTQAGTFSLSPTDTAPWITTTPTLVFFSATHPTNRFKTGFYRSNGTRIGMTFIHTMLSSGRTTVVGGRVFNIHPDANYQNAAGFLSSMADPLLRYYLMGTARAKVGAPMVAMRGELYFAGLDRETGCELHAIPIGAYSANVVPGCSRTTPPILVKTPPVMGKNVTVTVLNIPTKKIGFYVVGFSSPTWTHLGGHCQTVVDLTKPILLAPIRPDSSGNWSLTYRLPVDATMVGIIHPGQAVVGPTTTAPFGMDFSNGLHVHLDSK